MLQNCDNIEICRDWGAFKVRAESENEEWFTVSCERKGVDGGQFNRIYLRTCADYDQERSMQLLKAVTGWSSKIG